MSVLLELTRIRKLFPVGRHRQLHALDGIDLALAPGASLGVVGESGSGKSTLARLVAGLDQPTSGTIGLAADRPVQLVFQHAGDSLNPAFSAARNIAAGLGRVRLDPDTWRRVRAIATEVGLGTDLLDRRPHQLSGGQQARVGIARALVGDPRLLVLDEPTAALDVSVQATVLQLIDGLRRNRGIALMLVSHDLDVVRLMCDAVLVLYLGRVVEFGPAAQVIGAPRHPYTQALLDALPGRGRPRPLAGEPPSPIDPPAHACLFHSRCPQAQARCLAARPPLVAVDAGRGVACHLVDGAGPAAVPARTCTGTDFSAPGAC